MRKGAPAPGHRPAGVGGPALSAVLVTLLGTLLGVAAAVLVAEPAGAHTALERTTPADGSRVKTAPAQITLDFTQPPRPGLATVDVRGPGNGVMGAGKPRVSGDKVIQPLRPLSASGLYLIEWRVVALDGDPITGTLEFNLDIPGGAPSASAGPGQPPPTPVIRATPTFGAAANRGDGGVPFWGIGLGVLAAVAVVAGAALIGRQVTRDID